MLWHDFIYWAEFITKWIIFYRKVEEEVTNRLKDEVKNNYGVKIDATTDQSVDNLQIRVSNFLKYIVTTDPYRNWAIKQKSILDPRFSLLFLPFAWIYGSEDEKKFLHIKTHMASFTFFFVDLVTL